MPFDDGHRDDLRRARRGDRPAVERLVQVTRARIELMIRARLGAAERSWHVAEDLAQDVQAAMVAGLATLASDEPAGFRAYLSALVRNKVADYLRREARRPDLVVRARPSPATRGTALDLLRSVHATTTSPSERAARAEQIDLVLDEMARLPERYREVLAMAFFDELETAEIADNLGITRPAAAMLLLRAIRALQQRWPLEEQEQR